MSKHVLEEGGGEIILTETSKIDTLINLTRKHSVWYLLFGLACCGIELMQTGGPRADLDRFGAACRPRARWPSPWPIPCRCSVPRP